MKNRILSILLCLAMVCAMLPVSAIAEGNSEIVTDPTVIIQETTTETTQETTAAQQETSAPSQETSAPSQETSAPESSATTQETSAPSQETSAPAQEPGASVETTSAPAVDTTETTEATTAPTEPPKVRLTSPAPRAACTHVGQTGWTAVDQAYVDTNGMPTASGKYVLTESVNLKDAAWTIGSGKTIELCLNGNTITAATGKRVIHVKGGTLTIRDCVGTGKITGGKEAYGGGVRIDNGGVFNMYGGSIYDNEATDDGGGVYVTAANFNMYGGSIENNSAKNGGGLSTGGSGTKVLIQNAAITNNTAAANGFGGGGVYCGGTNPDITLSGTVTIIGNTKGTAASNLLVVTNSAGENNDRSIKQEALNAASRIGISFYNKTYPTLVRTGATADTTSCYIPEVHSNNKLSNPVIKYQNGKLTMIEKPTGAADHANTSGYTACGHGTTGWAGWYETNTLPAENGHFFLSADVTLADTWKIANGENITLCLNGKTITAASGKRAIEVTNGTLNLCDCTKTGRITGANVTVNGGAIFMTSANAKVNLYDITLSGNSANNGGAVGVYDKSAFTMTGGQITGNTAAAQGGGLYVVDGDSTVTLNGVTITGNTTTSTADGAAGGVHVNANASTTLKGKVIIADNFKGTGANQVPSNLEVDYDRLVIDDALSADSRIGISVYPLTNTQAINLKSKAAVGCYFSDDTNKVTQVDGNVLHLIAKPANYTGAHTGDHSGCGHATGNWITWNYSNKLPTATGNYCLGGNVTLADTWTVGSGVNIILCLNGKTITAASGKRAVTVSGGTLNLCDCTAKTENGVYTAGRITGADAAVTGAGVQVEKNSTFNMYNGMITGNKTTKDGAGVYVAGDNAAFNMYGGSIDNNQTTAAGGGICAGTDSKVNITGGEIKENKAANGGGMIVQGTNPTVLLKNVQITDNTATSNAGGVYVGYKTPDTTTQALTFSGNVQITGNKGGSNQIAANVQFMNAACVAHQQDLGPNAQIAVRKNSGTEIIASGATTATVQNYLSDSPAKVYQYENGKLYLIDKPENYTGTHTGDHSNCQHAAVGEWLIWNYGNKLPTVSGNYCLGGNVTLADTWTVGSGVEITLCLNGKTITAPTAKRAVLLSGGTLNLCDCTETGKITGADMTDLGAGVKVEKNSTFHMYAGHITGNKTTKDGAGVYVAGSNAVFNMYGGSITKNETTSAGGGICAGTDSKVNITGGEIKENKAANGGGMIVQGKNPTVLLKDVKITGNTATSNAGGVYLGYNDQTTNQSLTLSGAVQITGNTAAGKSNNLYLAAERHVVYTDTLTADASVGVRTNNTATYPKTVVPTGCDETVLACFTSDYIARILKLDGQKIVMEKNPNATHTPHATDECGHQSVSWTEWEETSKLPTANGHYYLIADVDLTAVWNAGDGKDITICLNGHNITQKTDGLRVIRVGSSTVNICDCQGKTVDGVYTSGQITGGNTDASDATGNAGAVLMTNGGKLRLYGGTIDGNKTEGNGTIVVQKSSTFQMYGGQISGNTVQKNGGAAYVISDGTFELYGGSITNNEATKYGGGIAAVDTAIKIAGGKIHGNRAITGAGGGIYAEAKSGAPTVEITGGQVSENIAKLDGGGIRVEGLENNKAKLTITGGEIRKNTHFKTTDPETGEESFTGGGGGLRAANCTVVIEGDALIVGNESSNAAGALFVNSTVTMNGGVIRDNVGTGNGPGVYASTGTVFTLNGGSIWRNNASANGGGVYLNGATMVMNGGEVRYNTGGYGGGIYNNGGSLTINGGEVLYNTANKVGGGGIYSVNNDKAGAKASVTITGGSIKENSSKSDGAGVRVDSGSFKMTGGSIEGNKAKDKASAGGLRLVNVSGAVISGGKITKNSGANAGGIYIKDSSLTISGGEISRNQTTGSGAGLMGSDASVTLSGGTITNNHAKGDGAGVYISGGSLALCGTKITKNQAQKVCGGVVVAKKANFSFTSGEISGNTAKLSSGGVMVQTGAKMTMTGGTVSGNISVNHGGGIYVNKDSSLELKDGVITGNAARKSGGGIYAGEGSKVTISGGSITRNDATTFGGGLSIHSEMTISGGSISANTSKKEGAGAYINNVKVTMTGGTFDGNITEYNGGGICVRGEKGLLELRDGKIINNKCKESGGGILVQGNGKLMMYGGKVCGNLAPHGGGGIRLHNCAAEIYGGQINENVTYGQGAGIYSNLSLIIKDAEVCDNQIINEEDIATRSSAAIRTYNESTLVMENVKVTGNTCDGRAGAIEIAYNVKAEIKNCQFADNSATERGGTFSVYREGVLNVIDSTITGSSTGGNGGVFSLDPYGNITLTDCKIKNNTANTGAVGYVATDSRAVFDGCTIKGNTAQTHASVLYANGDVVLKDTEITDNKDQRGGAAVCFDNVGCDTESYLPGVFEIMGNTVIHGNKGGDLVLTNDAFVNIPGDGLGKKAKIQVKTQDADITRWVIGPYDFKESGDGFLLTQGEGSLEIAFMADVKQPEQTEPAEQQQTETQPVTQTEETKGMGIGGWIGILAVLIAAAVALVMILRKKKK